jgi:hypothetical protein
VVLASPLVPSAGRGEATQNLTDINTCLDLMLACQGFTMDSSGQEFRNGIACVFFSMGVSEGILLPSEVGQGDKTICFPEDRIQRGQMANIVRKWIEENPDKQHLRAARCAAAALQQAFPCSRP